MRRAVVVGLATVAFVGGCGDARGGGEPAPEASAATTVYQPPADPCAAVPAAVAGRFGLEKPTRKTYDLFTRDDRRPSDPLVAYAQLTCFWSVPNPGRGPEGRPNAMTARVGYAVLTPDRPNAAGIAAAVFAATEEQAREGGDTTVVRAGEAAVECDEGYDMFVHEKSATGVGSGVEVTVRRANAVVTVALSGADLTLDRTRPRGLQLVTKAVAEARLRPLVDAILPGALALLR